MPTADDLSVLHLHDRHTELGLSADDLVGMYRTILTARVLDQKIWSLNRMGKAAFVVSGQGHEGAQVGAAWALRAGHDIVLPYYRDTGVMLTLGMTVEQILLAVLARADDPNSGARQMPNHWGWSAGNVITGSSPIATQLPHAAGLAYAAKLRGEDKVAVSFFGEGATSKGDFHEALNFAGIHQLPMVFVCENNGYAISVPMSSESAVDDVADRAHAYGFGGVIVDGNDPLDVYAAVHSAVRHARRGDGPTLVECKTYRYLAHTSDDDDRTYRTPAGGGGVAQEGPAAPDHPVPHRAAAAVGGGRGAHRGRGEGHRRHGRQVGRGIARRRSPAPPTAGCSPTRCARRPARPRGRATRAPHRSAMPLPEGGTRAQHRRHRPLDAAAAPRRRRPRGDPRRGRRAARRRVPRHRRAGRGVRPGAGARHARWPRARSSASASAWRWPGCDRSRRSSSPTSSTPGSTSSCRRPPGSTTAATATSRCRSSCGPRGAAACTARCTTRSRSRPRTPTSPG